MSTDIKMEDDTLQVSRQFAASPQRVFEAWTDPEQVQQWWGCNSTESVKATIDLQVGGTFHAFMKGGYGEMNYQATYEEIVPGEKLVYSLAMTFPNGGSVESKITIEFLEQDGGTLLRMTQTGFPMPEMREHVAGGFTASLDKLERLVTSEPAAA